jgi:hypothetical protein
MKGLCRIALITLFFRLSSVAEVPLTILSDRRDGAIRSTVMIAPLDWEGLESEMLALLRSDDLSFGRVVAYNSKRDALLQAASHSTSCDLQVLRAFLDTNGLRIEKGRCPSFAEAVKVGSDIVFRTVDSKCNRTKKLIHGRSDPLSLSESGAEHEIVVVTIPGIGPPGRIRELMPHVFIRTAASPTKELAANLAYRIRRISGARTLSVELRNDADFFRYCEFAATFIVDASATETVVGSKEVSNKEVGCSTFGPGPASCIDYSQMRQPDLRY